MNDSTNADAANLAAPIRRGALCRLDGGRVAAAYLDSHVGQPWGGKYRVQSADGTAWILDVARERLDVLTAEQARAYEASRSKGLQWIPVIGRAS
jgi:hypothetical protein